MAATWKKLAFDADKVSHSLATAANDFLVASGSGVFAKQTLAETQTTLGVNSGWIALGACTYEGADAPTFTFSIASDITGLLSVGQRIQLTQTTIKFFIITGVGAYSGGKTIVTVYGGTDYTLGNAAITLPYYSLVKAPFGFPLNTAKWTVEINDANQRYKASGTANTYYDLGISTFNIPIGLWRTTYSACLYLNHAAGYTDLSAKLTLSSSSTAESDADLTIKNRIQNNSTQYNFYTPVFMEKNLIVVAKTRYYLLVQASAVLDQAGILGTLQKTIVRAICAYL